MCCVFLIYMCVCVAGVFVGLGLSGVVPSLHFVISEGLLRATTMGQMGWLLLMATLYMTGACLYAARIPERFFPGKCDIWVCTRTHTRVRTHTHTYAHTRVRTRTRTRTLTLTLTL